jgi:hypothetical protein
MVGMQVILEGLALGSFINVRAATACDLLREMLAYVTKDEARHVAFGNIYLADAVAEMHADDRAAVEDFALEVTRKIVSMRMGLEGFAGFDDVLRESNIDPNDFLKALHAEVGRSRHPRLPRRAAPRGAREQLIATREQGTRDRER